MATANPTRTRRTEPVAARDAATTRTEKGVSLARGPALILGTILLAAGLYFLYRAHSFPRFANFPNGTAHKDGNFFLGIFGANGWTGELTAVAGGLLLFGAAHHLLAKTMSLIVGCALGAAAVIAVVSGNVLGMAAANGWTELGWAISAAILLFNAMIPRRTRTVVDEPVAATGGAAAGGMTGRERRRDRVAAEEAGVAGAGAGAGAGVAGERMAERHRMERDGMVEDRPTTRGDLAEERPVSDRRPDEAGLAGAGAGAGGAGAGAGAGMAAEPMAEDRTMQRDPMVEDRPMARDGMAEDRTLADQRMAEDPTAVEQPGARSGMAGTGAAGGGMADNETQMLQDRPRRFQRSGAMEEGAAGDSAVAQGEGTGQPTTGRRRGGLVGLLRRD